MGTSASSTPSTAGTTGRAAAPHAPSAGKSHRNIHHGFVTSAPATPGWPSGAGQSRPSNSARASTTKPYPARRTTWAENREEPSPAVDLETASAVGTKGKLSHTAYRVLKDTKEFSLLEVNLSCPSNNRV